jgi:hypothetical protein
MRYACWTVTVLAMGVLLMAPRTTFAQTAGEATAPSDSVQRVTHEGTGVVTAIEPDAHPQTVVVQTKAGDQDMTVGADVLEQTQITQGNTEKTLTDLKAGDRVWIRWKKTADALIADAIRILGPAS